MDMWAQQFVILDVILFNPDQNDIFKQDLKKELGKQGQMRPVQISKVIWAFDYGNSVEGMANR